MGDADNKAEEDKKALAQAQAKVDELTKKVDELSADLEKQKGIVENAETKFNEMAKETGDNRKAVTGAALDVMSAHKEEKKAADDLRKIQEELAALKKVKGPEAKDESNQKGVEQTADEIEANLTDAERKHVEKVWGSLDDKQRRQYRDDEKTRKASLIEAKAAVADEPPDLSTPWKKPAQSSDVPDGTADAIRKMFRGEQKRASNLPDGGGSSRSRGGGERPQRTGRTTNVLSG